MNSENQFLLQLKVFSKDAEEAIQFFYAWRAVNLVAAGDERIYRLLNRAPLFWNTVVGALLSSGFIALGRIFDQNSPHNVDKLLRIAQDNPNIFSLKALAERKRKGSENADEWITDYLRSAYVPTADDFRRLKKYVKARRRIYETNYRDIRHKVIAHNVCQGRQEVDALFVKTRVLELEKLLTFLTRLHDALWRLFYNGRKPTLRPLRYSVKHMLRHPSRGRHGDVQEEITGEVKNFLRSLASEKS